MCQGFNGAKSPNSRGHKHRQELSQDDEFGVSSLIVSSEDDIVGIVTERDILTRVVASGQNPEQVTVGEIMSEPIIV